MSAKLRAGLARGAFLARFAWGAGYPLRGLKVFARNRKVVLLSIGPFIVSLGVYVAAAALLIAFGGRITDLLIERGAWWRDLFRVMMMVGMALVYLVVFAFTYSILSLVIAAPFYEFLSAAAERVHTGEVAEEPTGWREILVDLWRGVTEALKFLLIEIGLLAFGLFCIPPFSSVVCFALSAVVIALEQMEGPMGRRRMTFRDKIRFARRHFWPVMGFGTVTTLALLVPVLGVAALPVGVVGGTLLFCDLPPWDGPGSTPAAGRPR